MQKGRRYQNLSDSQNFITNRKLIHRIIRFADFHANDMVLEIGTGKGHLTEELCRKAGMVCSVEIDRKLYESAGKATPDLSRSEYHEFQKFLERSMKCGICGKGGPLTKKQVSTALKQAGLPHAHETGVTLYIQWLCLFRCYQKMGKSEFIRT